MRVAGLIIGVLGSIAAFVGAIIAIAIGGIGSAFDAEGADSIVVQGYVALGASVVGLVGGVLSLAKPRFAAGMMAVSAIVGVIAVFVAYLAGGLLLLIGALLAFLGRNEARSNP